jgi:endo-1,4-beta-xylanase
MAFDARIARRTLLSGLAGTALSLMFARPSLSQPIALKAAAQARGLFWGAAVQHTQIKTSPDFAELVARECDVIVPEWEMKWEPIEKRRGKRDFQRTDAIVKFATEHRIKVRGHTLVWHRSIPDWANQVMAQEAGGWNVVASHIVAMLRRYGSGPFIHWDVLNEVIEPKHRRPDGLRISPFLRSFGPDYIPRALNLAHETAPSMPLYINEYGLDYDGSIERDRRTALLRLVEKLKRDNVALHGVGIQGHLRLDGSRFSASALRRFLHDLAALEVKIAITELDVRERDLDLPVAERDRRVADEVMRYLDVVLDEPALQGIVGWGLSDRYSWLTPAKLANTGKRNRGLPFDEALAAKPVTTAIVEALGRARARPPTPAPASRPPAPASR